MKFLKFSFLISTIFFVAACKDENKDFEACSSSSTGDVYQRSGSMNKCMIDKGYKLDGNAGTNDAFIPSKWKKLN